MQSFCSHTLEREMMAYQEAYPFVKVQEIGKSELGNSLWAAEVGKGRKKLFLNGAHHGLEGITSDLLMRFLRDYAEAYQHQRKLGGVDVEALYRVVKLYVVPMVNPDGVELAVHGLYKGHPCYKKIKTLVGNRDVKECWQANARGVDLNHNYDAMWEYAKAMEPCYGVFGAGPTRYGGRFPESEAETRAIVAYTEKEKFDMVMAFHAQGEEIYWQFGGMEPSYAKEIGQRLAEKSGYKLKAPEGIASYGGYKDWFIQKHKKAGYTVEVGKGKNPLPPSDTEKIYRRICPMILEALWVMKENPAHTAP